MAATAKGEKINGSAAEPGLAGTFQVVAARAKAMSPAEFRESLVDAGILGADGKLTSNYSDDGEE